MTYVYLDLETTGLDPQENGPIQVAFVITEADNDWREWDCTPFGAKFDYEASLVNGIFAHDFFTEVPPSMISHPVRVDFAMTEWLRQKGDVGSFIPIGWNVGSFDMQFIKFWFPNTYKMFGYRNYDLTGLRIFATEMYGLDREEMKRTAVEMVSDAHGWGEDIHNARYDAMLSLYEHQILTAFIDSHGKRYV